jgi:hypothetical protein
MRSCRKIVGSSWFPDVAGDTSRARSRERFDMPYLAQGICPQFEARVL